MQKFLEGSFSMHCNTSSSHPRFSIMNVRNLPNCFLKTSLVPSFCKGGAGVVCQNKLIYSALAHWWWYYSTNHPRPSFAKGGEMCTSSWQNADIHFSIFCVCRDNILLYCCRTDSLSCCSPALMMNIFPVSGMLLISMLQPIQPALRAVSFNG